MTNVINKNTFNLGLIGFKMAVTEGLTVFNLKDGVVDEFNDETGIDTAENSFFLYMIQLVIFMVIKVHQLD